MHYAHTAPHPGEPWQELEAHLRGVAQSAGDRGAAFDARDWARLAGLWHDLGKYSAAFQSYLKSADGADTHASDLLPRTDHSTAGAQHAARMAPGLGHILAFIIAGHHAGLPDADGAGASTLRRRLSKTVEPWAEAPSWLTQQPFPPLPEFLRLSLAQPRSRESPFAVALFTRMVFSALVDADFLDTEAFMSPEQAETRPVWPSDILFEMLEATEHKIASFGPPQTAVDVERGRIAEACREAAARSPGLFTLTVPTGGGKTLAGLLFALRHATLHGLRRVIYVAPFTSIIEQNASEYRKVMEPVRARHGIDPVIEHHSDLDPESESATSRRASENWDAPLVVTTAVQFYESLFANRSSRCRKLHNLVRSVVIIDEAQSIPVDLLDPCLRIIEALQRDYRTSIVLCTATQPAVVRSEEFPIGLALRDDAEIVPDVPALFAAMRRVEVRSGGLLMDEQVAERMLEEEQVLTIVNTRRHARILAEAIGVMEGHFHLSALMCPAHRTEVLSAIRARLKSGQMCRVASTQLIEAGVDLDFPFVMRAISGLDSIAQAAGRCNRNGRSALGTTLVFDTEHSPSERFIGDQVSSARQVLELHTDLLTPEAVSHYFRLHYWSRQALWDKKQVLAQFQFGAAEFPFLFGFREAAARFQMIETTGVTVIVPWGDQGTELCNALRTSFHGPNRTLLRKLQRFTVQVPARVWSEGGWRAFEMVHGEYPVLSLPDAHYSPYFGLILDGDVGESLIT